MAPSTAWLFSSSPLPLKALAITRFMAFLVSGAREATQQGPHTPRSPSDMKWSVRLHFVHRSWTVMVRLDMVWANRPRGLVLWRGGC
jgi:hypothetical protein